MKKKSGFRSIYERYERVSENMKYDLRLTNYMRLWLLIVRGGEDNVEYESKSSVDVMMYHSNINVLELA
jgi:hypothetical protein